MSPSARSLDELRAIVGALDPDVLAAERDVDRTFAHQMLDTLMRFRRVEPSGL